MIDLKVDGEYPDIRSGGTLIELNAVRRCSLRAYRVSSKGGGTCPSGRVVDEAGILDPSTKAPLERKLAEFETKPTGQLVVVTVKSLQGLEGARQTTAGGAADSS